MANDDFWSWTNSPLMGYQGNTAPVAPTENPWGPQPAAPQARSPFWDPSYQPGMTAQDAAEAAAMRMRAAGGGQGYRGNYTPDQQAEYANNVRNVGEMGAAAAAPWTMAALNGATGDYHRGGMEAGFAALPYVGRFIRPFLKPAAALYAGGSALGLGDTAEGAGQKQAQAAPAAPAASQYDPDPEIAALQRDQAKAVETGRHSKQAGDMAKAQADFDARIEAVRTRKRGENELATYRTGVQQDPEFTKLPDRYKSDILKAPSMDEANKAFSKAKEETTPFAVRNHDLVKQLELGGMALGAALPFGQSLYDRFVLGNAARGADKALTKAAAAGGTDAAAETALNTKAEQLRAFTGQNYSALAPGHVATHAAIGTALPFAAGSVFPNFMDAVTLPEGSEGQQKGTQFFNPTRPEFWQALGRAATEGGTVAVGAGGAGHVAFRPDVAKTRGLGVLSSIDKRAAGFEPPVGMRSPAAALGPASADVGALSPTFGGSPPSFTQYGPGSTSASLTVPNGMTPRPTPPTPSLARPPVGDGAVLTADTIGKKPLTGAAAEARWQSQPKSGAAKRPRRKPSDD